MVCLGNICRSPLAEGIMKDKLKKYNLSWEVDSAGTSGWHQGELPDSRSIQIASQNGIDITDQRSRLFVEEDFDRFDLIVAMDSSNYSNILSMAKNSLQNEKLELLMNFAYPDQNMAIPDPYYDGGFQKVFEMISEAAEAIIQKHMKE